MLRMSADEIRLYNTRKNDHQETISPLLNATSAEVESNYTNFWGGLLHVRCKSFFATSMLSAH